MLKEQVITGWNNLKEQVIFFKEDATINKEQIITTYEKLLAKKQTELEEAQELVKIQVQKELTKIYADLTGQAINSIREVVTSWMIKQEIDNKLSNEKNFFQKVIETEQKYLTNKYEKMKKYLSERKIILDDIGMNEDDDKYIGTEEFIVKYDDVLSLLTSHLSTINISYECSFDCPNTEGSSKLEIYQHMKKNHPNEDFGYITCIN